MRIVLDAIIFWVRVLTCIQIIVLKMTVLIRDVNRNETFFLQKLIQQEKSNAISFVHYW